MSIKRNFAVTVLDSEKISSVIEVIIKYARITMQSSSHIYFNTQPVNSSEIAQDITFFQIESEDKIGADKILQSLIEDLDQLNTDYAIRDEDTGKMLAYVEFVGALDIIFDNLKFIKEGTYKKIDELKSYKSELGTCKGYKPSFRPMESQSIENRDIKHESIYLFCHTQEDLMKLKEKLSEKILEIDSGFKVEFRQFMGENPEYGTKIGTNKD